MNNNFSNQLIKYTRILFLSIFLLTNVVSCSGINIFSQAQATEVQADSLSILSQAEVVFQVLLPSALPENASLSVEIEDDVTGLAFNPTRIEMAKQDDRTYYLKTNLVIGSVVKYRYIRTTDGNSVEYTPQNSQVRYRLANISGPTIIQDNISAWIDSPYNGPIGRVRGQFLDKTTNAPIPNLLVSAEGVQTVTSSDGSFILEGLTPGTHNLVAYSMDGLYVPFSQGVTIAEEATTPVFVYTEKRKTVDVTFNVTIPDGYNEQMPLRFVSNLQSLGNSYADLLAGNTSAAANLPVLSKISDHHYQIKLNLPSGFDLRYKYTFGDGIWNSELDSTGAFSVRQVIVPGKDTTIDDSVATFTTPGAGPVSFVANIATSTPADETVTIQLNPYAWFESIPMTKLSDNQWVFSLYSPFNLFNQVQYRFCRNDLCDFTSAKTDSISSFTVYNQPQTVAQEIDQWENYSETSEQNSIITDAGPLTPRTDFIAGFETDKYYFPFSTSYLDSGLKRISQVGANYVVLSPTYSATRNTPPYLESVPGKDISWPEIQTAIIKANQDQLNTAIFPQINYPNSAAAYWASASRDEGWWNSWYDRYHRFMISMADLATLSGASTIIIGDPSVSPSMSGGKLADGTSANSPQDADNQWRQLIKDIRANYSGTILGAVSYPSSDPLPGWLDSVDGIYVIYSAPLSQSSSASIPDLISIFQTDLNSNLLPSLSTLNKPVVLAINYPSSSDAYTGCTDTLGSCLDDWGNGQLDLSTQLKIYNAAIIAAEKDSRISGFVSRGNKPIAAVVDSSPSVLSKPSSDVLWFWYHFILNKSPE
jgi:hypothetical protein